MNSLPIRFLTDEDSLIFGPLNVALGKLARSGLPVAEGMVTIQVNSEPRVEISHRKLKASGNAFYDSLENDVVISVTSGKPHPRDLKKITEIVLEANKKLFIPHVYEWILDGEIKLVGLSQYTPFVTTQNYKIQLENQSRESKTRSAVKVFLDLSEGLVVEKQVDGIFIDSDASFDELVLKIVEAANTFPRSPILVKLTDQSYESILFVINKKELRNIYIVVPAVRGVNEFAQVKRQLAVKKLTSKHSLQLWLELAIPENIINLEDYLLTGLDGVVLNLDQLIAHLNGFDLKDQEFASYKKEVKGMLRFLEDGIRILHKTEHKFLAFGSIGLNPEVLDFLVEGGVYGIVVERYDAHSANDYLYQAEKRMILRHSI